MDSLHARIGEFLKCGLHAPDLTSILGNGAIAREFATSGNIVDNLLGPFLGVLVKSIDLLLAFDVVFIVSKDLKSVMMHQHVDNFFKQVRLLWAKVASSNLVNSLFQLWQAVVV